MSQLQDSLVELIRRTSAEIPDDVHQAILTSLENEKKNKEIRQVLDKIDAFWLNCALPVVPPHVCYIV